MAKILYDVKKNTNTASKTYGQWYGRTKSLETLNTRRLAQHIAEHGSIYTPDVVYGVLEKFRSCLVEMLLESKKVKIDGLGTFYTTLESAGAASKDKYNVQEHISARSTPRSRAPALPRRTSTTCRSTSRVSTSASCPGRSRRRTSRAGSS